MITLTVNPGQEHKKHSFPDGKVSIGRAMTEGASLNLEKEPLEEVHVKIVREGNKFYAYNTANDPFVTLNDIPFGKREIKNGDLLQIGKTLIEFEANATAPSKPREGQPTPLSSTKNLSQLVEEKIRVSDHSFISKSETSSIEFSDIDHQTGREVEIDDTLRQIQDYLDTLPSDDENSSPVKKSNVAPLFDESQESEDIDIDALVKEVEKLEVPDENSSAEEGNEANHPEQSLERNDEKPKPPQKNETSKSLPLSLDRTNKRPLNDGIPQQISSQFMLPQEDPKPQPAKMTGKASKWKLWIALVVLLIITGSLIFNGVYGRLQETSMKGEVAAAREVADIALALTYAQLNHIQPERQNWTDPIFLTNSIRSVLGGQHKPYGTIDSQGRIIEGKYFLRIYNNRDMTRFIVIAQPEASLTQWLSPQRAIVIDSKDMVLHKVNDLRPLNRLLVNVNSLSGESGKALYDLIKNEEMIPLSVLSNKNNLNGFAPPKQLELMKIGAENYVYNAPRYSQIGEKIMETAVDLVSRPGSSTEFKKLEEDAKLVSKLPDAVMYTSKGMKAALKAQKALATLLPSYSFLIGYLQIDDQGNMKGSHLIFDLEAPRRTQNTDNDHTHNIAQQQSKDLGGYQPLLLAANASDYLHPRQQARQIGDSNRFYPSVDAESPLYLQVTSLAKERQEHLQALSELIINLIEKNNREYVENFPTELQKLIDEYQSESVKSNQQVVKKLENLYREYDFMPMSEFNEYVAAAGLSQIAESHLKNVSSKMSMQEHFNEASFNDLLMDISKAKNFEELHKYVTNSSKVLRLENIPNSSKLIAYQNKLRTQVLQSLNELLLSPEHHLSPSELTRENRMRLSQILIYSWVSEPEEQNFYLSEFDNLAEPASPL